MEVVNAYLSDGRLRVLRRDENGELVEQRHRPEYALFIRTADLAKCERALRSTSRVKTIRNEGEFVRIVCRDYDSRDRLINGTTDQKQGWFTAQGIQTFEADLSPARRWLIDTGVTIQKPLAGYLDLEWDSRVPFADKGRARMLCWAVTLWNGDRVGGVLSEDTDEAEAELILDLFYELDYVDQVLAWNGDRADFEYLQERIKRLGLQVDWRRWLWLDHMELFRKLNATASESGDEKASMALSRVAESLEVRGKLEGVAGKHTWEWWAAGGEKREKLLLYCCEDTATMFRIEEKTGYVSILATLAQTCGVFPDSRGMRGVAFVESYLMRLGAQRGMRAPSKTYFGDDEQQEQFRGAFVFPTGKRGLIRNVHTCDFTRLYPSIMQAWNMSPETHVAKEAPDRTKIGGILYRLKDGTAEAATPSQRLDKYQVARLREEVDAINQKHFAAREAGVACAPFTLEHFRLEERGLFALALDEITSQRAYWSKLKASLDPGTPEWLHADRMDNAYKIIANTFYGVSGSVFSRYYLREVSESVTQVGVWLIQATAEEGLRRGMSLVAGDTDSGLFEGCTEAEFKEFVDYCNRELYPRMLAPTGADNSRISLAFEKSFSLMINIEKKCYAGRLAHYKGKVAKDTTKPVIKGLEYKRGDSAKLARSFQQEIVESLLFIGKPLPDKLMTPADLEAIVERWQKHILEKRFTFEHAVIAQAMKNPIDEYGQERADGSRPPVPRHVQIARILAERGEAIYPGVKIEFVVTDGKSTPQKCKPASDCTINDVDLYHLWESTVWPAAERVLVACYPDHLWARWGSVRPTKGVLPGQVGFGWGERRVLV